MTPEIDEAFAAIRSEYGAGSLARVEEMMRVETDSRHPLQQGARWVLPGISQQPWHDPYAYPEFLPLVRELEAAHGDIKREITESWATRRERFARYDHYLGNQEDWRAVYLFRRGAMEKETAELVPTAHRIVERSGVDAGVLCPLLESHFSTLLPGTVIADHCDLWNFSINLHLAVSIPDDCSITVADERRSWEEGRCLLFDYSFRHSARNDGAGTRTCLLVDLWHPETTAPERRALTVLVTEVRALMGES
ncbi:aspartyl/asparaginyl beta-hydroxylase domain-containing protein [Streptomyces spiramenti]|uniref:Aspartyl/asparaginyl beta-hydroxylase domain-containing protein n=1 Tax=Streptomyces spiramenti TaxID=2720606 RepID=A0ABX1AGJ9_9ACTN|nr:aspartyl/asparaginyl beta-hydroxylase domain-containing protein [Streptomyces spiramenti]NJP64751.1 aspartyl/asparaginyl beta-hydroxylase domain-containing protein [Streptomyces spiramenti]